MFLSTFGLDNCLFMQTYRRFVSIAAVTALCLVCSAQTNELSRKQMTMEEAVLGTGVLIENPYWHWTGDKNIAELCSPASDMPDAYQFAYTKGNNLFWRDAAGNEHAITEYDDRNIVCGSSVSRNEFGIDGGIFVSPDSSKIAFYRKDESKVTSFPLLDITTRTGTLREIKYPMNGMESEVVSLGVYDINDGTTTWMNVTDFDDDRYLTNITWGPDNATIYIQVLDRSQKHVHLNSYDASTGDFIKTILTEDNSRFVEPQWPLYFLSGDPSRFIYTTDNRDGYKNLYLCNLKDNSVKRLTDVDADVEYLTQDRKYVYYYSYQDGQTQRQLYRVALKNGIMEKLTSEHGTHTCTFSNDGKYFIDNFTSTDMARCIKLRSADGKEIKELFRLEKGPELISNCIIETGTIKSADGLYDNPYSLVKPLDFDPSKKYPVVLYVYGGPHNQMITDTYNAGMSRWDIYMAQHGYIVFTMDNRGTLHNGADYEKAIHRQCGKAEMEDQMEGMKWLMSQPWVDCDRIGVHGWSYGGFMTISLMVNYPEVFKVGVAGGPVIDWKWYEIMYGERYMETEATNPEGFASTSLLSKAKDLKGKLLICQGAIDDTVVWEHSLSFIENCIKNNVQVDYFPYPTHPHNVRGKDRVHLMNKVTNYFDDYLK